jgi:NDP-sugar pyrophosphorylase family protein
VIEKIIRTGCSEIVVNVHHFPDQIRQFLAENDNYGVTIHVSDESDAILDTGGGLMKAACFLRGNEPILLHNVDIICNLDLNLLVDYHHEKKTLVTLVVRDRKSQRYLHFTPDMRLSGWTNRATGETRAAIPEMFENSRLLAFSGIHVIDPEFLNLMTGNGKFSLIDSYLEMTRQYPVKGYLDHSSLWMDVGKPDQLAEAEKLFLAGKIR